MRQSNAESQTVQTIAQLGIYEVGRLARLQVRDRRRRGRESCDLIRYLPRRSSVRVVASSRFATPSTQTVDASVIDSTVLETEFLRTPELRRQLRVVTTLGPSPIPPLVVSRAVPSALRNDLRIALLDMHRDPRASHVLASGRVHRYVQVQDADYDPIRIMADIGANIAL
jgi:hypothetical protein